MSDEIKKVEVEEEQLEEAAGGKKSSKTITKTTKYCLECMKLKKGAKMNVPTYKYDGKLFCLEKYHVYAGSMDGYLHMDPVWVKGILLTHKLPR